MSDGSGRNEVRQPKDQLELTPEHTEPPGSMPGAPGGLATAGGPASLEAVFLNDLREAFLGTLRWFVGVSRAFLRPDWGDFDGDGADPLGEFLESVESPELRDSDVFRAISNLHARVTRARRMLGDGRSAEDPSSYDRFAALFLRLAETVERAKAETVLVLAGTDRLTGLPNRSAMDADLEWAHRTQRLFTVAIADIDRFKPVNDSLGHLVGDQILAAVAQRLADNARAGDRVYRFGGEEFLLLLPEADERRAQVVLERIRRAVSDHPVQTDDREVNVAVSIGFAVWRKGGNVSPNEILAAADRHLYAAKESGRNQVRG